MYMAIGGGGSSSLYDLARGQNVFCSYSTGVTALPAYTATSLGPVLFNGAVGNPQLKAVIIGISLTVTTASAAAVSVGLAWGVGTVSGFVAATKTSSTYANASSPVCNAYISGNVSVAASGYLPLVNVDTAALTANPIENMWVPLDGMIVIPQGSYVALAAGATATTSVLDYSIVWAEVRS